MVYKYIRSFSASKKDILSRIDDVARPILEHLAKIYLMSDSGSFNHWVSEIYGFLNKCSKLKGRNRYPSKKDLLQILYYNEVPYLKYTFEGIRKDYNTMYQGNYNQYQIICFQYLDWLSDMLSKYGRVYFSDVQDKIVEVLDV